MRTNTKTYRIKQHLRNHKSITSWEAIQKYGVTRLAAIIFILRKNGWVITSKDITFKDRYGNSGACTRYEFIGEQKPKIKDTQISINY